MKRSQYSAGLSGLPVLIEFTLGAGALALLLGLIIYTLARMGGAYSEESLRRKGPVLTGMARGEQIFSDTCWACHGTRGVGGIPNENYIKETIPALNVLAERFQLRSKADADRMIAYLDGKITEQELTESLKDSKATVVLAQFQAIKKVIQNGSIPGKKDPKGPIPPRQMPTWKEVFSEQEIHWIIGYLLSLYDWSAAEDE